MPIINTKEELNKDLCLVTSANGENSLHRAGQDHLHSLPGQARISLDNVPLQEYLRKTLLAPKLDKIAPYLWLVRNRYHFLSCVYANYYPRPLLPIMPTSPPSTSKPLEDVASLLSKISISTLYGIMIAYSSNLSHPISFPQPSGNTPIEQTRRCGEPRLDSCERMPTS
jgi:hypothetical protein